MSIGFVDDGRYQFGGGDEDGGTREGHILGHFRIDEAGLDGEDVDAFMEEPVTEAGEVGGETGFGAAVEIIALATAFACDGTDTGDEAAAFCGVVVGDEVEDGNRADVIRPGGCVRIRTSPIRPVPGRRGSRRRRW